MTTRPKRILILGGGTAGWVTASVLARDSRELGYEVTVIDSAEIPTIGVGEASIPTIYDLLRFVELEDTVLIKESQATFKFGIEFENWSTVGSRYMHGFGNMGTSFGGTEFFRIWLATAAYFSARDLGPFTPAVTAAYANRFCRVAKRPEFEDRALYYPLCELSYALHFDAAQLAQRLKTCALRAGATHLSHHVTDVEVSGRRICALNTRDGRHLEADLFVDCTGMISLLARKTLELDFEDWTKYLPCNAAFAVQTARNTPPRPYTRSVAHEAGWRWEIQLQNRTGNGIVYSSAHMADERARAILLDSVDGDPLSEPRKISFQTGRLTTPWTENCVAIGLSSGFLEPLESTSIHLICKYAMRLQEAIRDKTLSTETRHSFNAEWQRETEEIRDFLVAHYVVNQRTEPFWQSVRDMELPPTLRTHFRQLSQMGWMDLPETSLFGHDSWFQVLVGQEFPFDYGKFAVSKSGARPHLEFLKRVAQSVSREVNSIRHSHQEALEEIKRNVTS